MDATHVYCARCRSVQPVRFERLLPSEAALGTQALCASCGWFVFTLLTPAKVYCDVCDDIRPALLHAYAPSGALTGGLVRCAVCYASRARLYGSKVSTRSSS
jgi:hypothetical protein